MNGLYLYLAYNGIYFYYIYLVKFNFCDMHYILTCFLIVVSIAITRRSGMPDFGACFVGNHAETGTIQVAI